MEIINKIKSILGLSNEERDVEFTYNATMYIDLANWRGTLSDAELGELVVELLVKDWNSLISEEPGREHMNAAIALKLLENIKKNPDMWINNFMI